MSLRIFLAVALLSLLSACGGVTSGPTLAGTGAGTGGSTVLPPTPVVANTATVTLDAGPAALQSGAKGYSAFNEPYVTVTICAPGSTTNCQAIDHVILDTGSVGLRLIAGVLNPALLSALPSEKSPTGNPVGECYQYVNSYAFGSVRTLDFTIAGEKVASMPAQIIADTGTFATVPAACSSGGGSAIMTVNDFAANGIIGVGTTANDCGAQCTTAGGSSGASYYDCPATGCSTIIARAATIVAPFEQLPNPVAAFATDNNGTIITLPSVPQAGVTSLTGSVVFGIGTQTDNALTATNILPVTTSASSRGAGVLTATYNGAMLTQSFLDSGSNEFYFIDATLSQCTSTNLTAFYCPAMPASLSPTLTAVNGTTASAAFTLYSPLQVAGTATVAPGLGINPTLVTPPLHFANSFDFGLPFFFGKTVYTAIEGKQAGSTAGPYFAY